MPCSYSSRLLRSLIVFVVGVVAVYGLTRLVGLPVEGLGLALNFGN